MVMNSPTPNSADSASYIRLHVTPLDADLVKVIISSALLPKARNISYHAIDTFPENRYGFLDLPKEDAEKLRKKLNGAVLKGVKIRIEPARKSSGIPTPLGEEAMAGDKSPKRKESREDKAERKKRKRDDEKITGVVLEEGRKVKRGWTTTENEPKDKRAKKDKKDKKDKKEKKQQSKSKYTKHEECLIKTVLPANVSTSANADGAAAAKKKKKHANDREVVIHEFEKTTKFPTFLKTTASSGPPPAPLEFVEGQGWVDEKGNVVEAVKSRRKEGKSSKKSKDKDQEVIADKKKSKNKKKKASSDTDGSASGSETENPAPTATAEVPEEAGEEEEEESPTKSDSFLRPEVPGASKPPTSPSSAKGLTIKIPPATPKESKVHPLEALYKKPQQADGASAQDSSSQKGFSFFGNADDHSEEEVPGPSSSQVVPMTPFTREDIEERGIRSAAPTPDTAHPSRRFKPWVHEDDDIEEEEEEGGEEDAEEDVDMEDAGNASAAQAVSAGGEHGAGESTSDFQKWFWENRGDLNRSWKKRRKMASKEKRYRENKARLARAI
ncbi:hypothetical protein B0H66DRAFT_561781 [Apodospora peruviana]|uniref:Uncharacterized protein n=1 Tax=Apodospora peruviana TaxID=516989 RepID=A0AAE0M292_9PEZI|nr:hypothetical protein B0H66DRAFT_561781 [Apodospora peruviana]